MRVVAILMTATVVLGTDASGLAGQSARRKLAQKAAPGATLELEATAYCTDGTTKSGVETESGVAAADPVVLPQGSVIRVVAPETRYSGIYTVLDTGQKVQGKVIDLFVPSCDEAQVFGRKPVEVTVLRRGWDPQKSAERQDR